MFQPPEPPNWPIVGSLFYLNKLSYHSMEKLLKKYWPIMFISLGYLDYIIISSVEMATEVLRIHDAKFASRPRMLADKYVGFDWSNIVTSPHGDHWCLIGKICVEELFTQARLKSFQLGNCKVACMVENIIKHNQGRNNKTYFPTIC